MATTNEELNKKFIDLWEQGKTEYIDEIISSDFEHHYNGETMKGKDEYKKFYNSLLKNFNNLKFTVDEHLYPTKDVIVNRWRAKGDFSGKCGEKDLSQKNIEFGGLTLLHTKDGKLTAGWFYNDLPEVLYNHTECK